MEVLGRFIAISLLLLCFLSSDAQNTELQKDLDALKHKDQLSEWLYTRIDYANTKRREQLSFLMSTEKAAWRKPKKLEEKEAWLLLYSNQGYNQLFCGNILQSINSYEKAYNFWEEQGLNSDISDYVLKPWANNYTRLGDYERALFIQKKTLDFAEKAKDALLSASTYNNMAISYRSLGDLKQAEQCIIKGKQQAAGNSALNILLNNTLADINKDEGKLALAEKVIAHNIDAQRNSKLDLQTAYWLLGSYVTAGDIQFDQKHYDKAAKHYQQALDINKRYYNSNRLREQAYVLTQLGKIKARQQKPQAAKALFKQTLSTLGLLNSKGAVIREQLYGDNRLVDVLYQKSLASLQLGHHEEALNDILFALESADKIRFELADAKTRQRFQHFTKRMAEEAMTIAFRLLEKAGEQRYAIILTDIAEKSKARTLLDDIRKNQQQLALQGNDTLLLQKQRLERAIAYNEKELLQDPDSRNNNSALKFELASVEKKLRNKYPSLRNDVSKGSLSTILKKLPRQTHFLEFFMGEEHAYAIEIKAAQVRRVKRIGNAKTLRAKVMAFVNTFYRNGPGQMIEHPQPFYQSSFELYNIFLSGFQIEQHEDLVLIPDEVLGYLSFDGLISHPGYKAAISSWPFLIKQANISYAFSLQTLDRQWSRDQNLGTGFSGLFIPHEEDASKTIPAVAKEAESLKNLLSGNFIKDKKATAASFFKAFEKSAVLHISTHAYLSGAQQEPTIALQDSAVFLFELSARKSAPKLVVLSACRTGDGMLASGEGIVSLSRGFAAIGTQGTIAGLWNVNDKAAAAITADSYKYLLEGEKISQALRKAKLNWLAGTRNAEQEYLPYYWDAFVYLGCNQTIALTPATNWTYILIGLALVLIITCSTYFVSKRAQPKAAS